VGFENPLNDPEGNLVHGLRYLEYVITGIFVFEMLMNIIASGLIANGKQSYLRDTWNIVDFVIVIVSIISLLPANLNFNAIKTVRMLRLLRPLRVIQRSESLRLSVQALVVSVPAILSLLVIVVLIMIVFATVGVNLLKGKAFVCDYGLVVGLSQKEIERLFISRADCWNYGGTFKR